MLTLSSKLPTVHATNNIPASTGALALTVPPFEVNFEYLFTPLIAVIDTPLPPKIWAVTQLFPVVPPGGSAAGVPLDPPVAHAAYAANRLLYPVKATLSLSGCPPAVAHNIFPDEAMLTVAAPQPAVA